MLFLLIHSGINAQNPFDLIDQYAEQKSTESYSKVLEDNDYYPVAEDNIETEQHYRKGKTDIFLTSDICNYIVISSTNLDFNKSIETELDVQRHQLVKNIKYGRIKLSWNDKSNNTYFVLINPDGSYELYYANCTSIKPLSTGQP